MKDVNILNYSYLYSFDSRLQYTYRIDKNQYSYNYYQYRLNSSILTLQLDISLFHF